MLYYITSIIIICGAVQGLFISALLFSIKKGNRAAHQWLAGFLLVFSISMIWAVLHQSKLILKVPALAYLYAPLTLLEGPFFYFYARSLAGIKPRLLKWQSLHFVPFIISLGWFIPFFIKSPGEKLKILVDGYDQVQPFILWFTAASIFVTAAYVFISVLTIRQHTRAIRFYYSSEKGKTLSWLENLIVLMLIVFFVCVALTALFNPLTGDTFSNLLFSVIIYYVAYRSLREPESVPGMEEITMDALPVAIVTRPEKEESGRYEKSGLNEQKAAEGLERLNEIMKTEKVFLDPELDLKKLAEKIDLTPHQLSQVLNQSVGATFFDYINRHRVEYFKSILNDVDKQHLSLLGLAFESGFNSKSTFNAVFKRQTGYTPSEFKKLQQSS